MYKNAYELAQKRKRKDDFAEALVESRQPSFTANQEKQNNNFVDSYNKAYNQAGGEGDGLNNLAKQFANKLGSGSSTAGTSNVASSSLMPSFNSSMDNISFMPKADSLSFMNNGSSTIGNIDNLSFANSGQAASKAGGLFKGFGSGSGGGTPWGAIAGLAKGGYNAITDKQDKDYSDTEEGIIYPLQGAAMGSSFGPWGALAGALYGFSYGMKDDTNKLVGIKEGSFWDKLRHPIGMGDGGGFIDIG